MKEEYAAGICLLGNVPMRIEPSETCEMVSQLLFGETFTVVRHGGKWLHICSDTDGYKGWVSSNMVHAIPEGYQRPDHPYIIDSPYSIYSVAGRHMYLPGGSILPAMLQDSSFELAGNVYRFSGGIKPPDKKDVAELAKLYLNAPYLWGGKTIFGMDCSGLVQVVCRMTGRWLPRDASQQEKYGEPVSFDVAGKGDLAFFHNENGKVTHVGILCDMNNIIHASGYVRIDRFDREGIFNETANCYTHRLHSIKRFTDNDEWLMING